MHIYNKRRFFVFLFILFLVSGGWLVIRLGYVPEIGKFFASEPNSAPSVTLKSSGECVANCTAFFEATAADYDGDPLSYAWSGCASGSSNKAQCAMTGSATVVTATVTVSDGRGGQTNATITAHASGMKTAADFSGKYILFNGNFGTPNGSTVMLGYAALNADGTAGIYYLKTGVGDYSNTTKKHNAMRLTPGIFPPNYNPNCQPGFITAGNFRMVQRSGSWSFNGSSLQIHAPDIEYASGPPEVSVGFTFSWTPEQGSQTQSLILRSVMGDNDPSPWYAGGVYGYAYLSSQSPYSSAQLTASQFSENYWGLSAIRQGFGANAEWTYTAPELTDAYMTSIGGFFPLVPAFHVPLLSLGYYSDADPNVWGRTILLVNDPRSVYGNHTWLFNYDDFARPPLSHTLMYWHGGHDFSDNGCYDPASDSGGHILTNLGVLEGGEITKVVAIETGSEYGKLVLSRWFKVAYPSVTGGPPPPPPDQTAIGSNDGATYTVIPTEGGGIIEANSIFGWAFDPDAPAQTVTVHLYFDGEPGACPAGTCILQVVTADKIRGDVNRVFGITGNHGFTFDITQLPARFLDGQNHTVSAYAINIAPQGQTVTAGNPLIGTKTFTLLAPPPTPIPTSTLTPTPTPTLTPSPTCWPRPICLDTEPRCLLPVPAEGWCPTPTPTCAPRPACLDAVRFACKMPEPAEGWCPMPTPTPPPGCYYHQVQCIRAPCEPELVCPSQTPAAAPGDANGDGRVNILDFNIVISFFGQSGSGIAGDVNGDGTVNILDFGLVVSHFGQ